MPEVPLMDDNPTQWRVGEVVLNKAGFSVHTTTMAGVVPASVRAPVA